MIANKHPKITAINYHILNFEEFNQKNEYQQENLFLSKNWILMLMDEFDFPVKVLLDESTGEYLTFAEIYHFGINKIVSLPFSDYTIPTVNSKKKLAEFQDVLKSLYPDDAIILKLPYSCTNENESLFGNCIRSGYYHRVKTSSIDEIDNSYSSSFRRGVKKAFKSEVEIRVSKQKASIEPFYNLYLSLRKNKFKRIPQPYSFFEKIYSYFIESGNGFFMEAVIKDKVISSTIILASGNTWYYKFGCSDPEYLSLRPNNLIFHELFILANNKGIDEVDLGLSGTGDSYAGLRRFKEGMGGKQFDLCHFRLDPPNYNHQNEGQFNSLLKDITDGLVKTDAEQETIMKISKSIYKYFA